MYLGCKKTLAKMYEFYWFDKMSKYARKFVDSFITCRLSKPPTGKVQAELHPTPKVNVPFYTVQREYIIVQIDPFFQFVCLFYTTRLDSDSCIKVVRSLVLIFGVPSRLIADLGRSTAFRDFWSAEKIDRVMSTLKSMLTVKYRRLVESANKRITQYFIINRQKIQCAS